MSSPARMATFTSTGWVTSLKVVTRPRDVLMGHNPRNQSLWPGVKFVSGVYPGRRFHRLTGRRLIVPYEGAVSVHGDYGVEDRKRSLPVQIIQDV